MNKIFRELYGFMQELEASDLAVSTDSDLAEAKPWDREGLDTFQRSSPLNNSITKVLFEALHKSELI